MKMIRRHAFIKLTCIVVEFRDNADKKMRIGSGVGRTELQPSNK